MRLHRRLTQSRMATPPSLPYVPSRVSMVEISPTAVALSAFWELTRALQATTAGLTSLRSSVLKFQEENGRTYHSMSGGSKSPPPLSPPSLAAPH